MSNLKDTDIDDLFRRASDKYPLRTDSADWDRMAAALENKGPEPPNGPVEPEEKRKRRFFWLFLLLLPLAGAGYYAWYHAGNGNTGDAGNTGNAVAKGNGVAPTTTTPAAVAPNGAAPATATSAGAVPAPAAAASAASTSITGTTDADRAKNGASLFSATRNHQHRNGEKDPGENNSAAGNPAAGEGRLFYDLQRAPIPRDYRLAVDVTAPTAKKDSAKPKAKIKHFYAGVFGSPDLSTVKMQSVMGVGSTFGVILGYTFNGGHWALETGAYVDRKKYYTDGEYFNTKEVHLPANSWLTDVNGVCYMWEIPLNVRYNFNPGAKTSWFATAGFSTYLMSHEKYAYGLEWPGSTSAYDSSWNIHKPSQYPFSIINLSAGFEQRLGKIGNLRIEPYVRLPLTGLGTGKLPIMSAGVNIGITRQLW